MATDWKSIGQAITDGLRKATKAVGQAQASVGKSYQIKPTNTQVQDAREKSRRKTAQERFDAAKAKADADAEEIRKAQIAAQTDAARKVTGNPIPPPADPTAITPPVKPIKPDIPEYIRQEYDSSGVATPLYWNLPLLKGIKPLYGDAPKIVASKDWKFKTTTRDDELRKDWSEYLELLKKYEEDSAKYEKELEYYNQKIAAEEFVQNNNNIRLLFTEGIAYNSYLGADGEPLYMTEDGPGRGKNPLASNVWTILNTMPGFDPHRLDEATADETELTNWFLYQQDPDNPFITEEPPLLTEFNGYYVNVERFIKAFGLEPKVTLDFVKEMDDKYRDPDSRKMVRVWDPRSSWDKYANKGLYGPGYIDRPLSRVNHDYNKQVWADFASGKYDGVEFIYHNEDELLQSDDPEAFYVWSMIVRNVYDIDPEHNENASTNLAYALIDWIKAKQSLRFKDRDLEDVAKWMDDKFGKYKLMTNKEARKYVDNIESGDWAKTFMQGRLSQSDHEELFIQKMAKKGAWEEPSPLDGHSLTVEGKFQAQSDIDEHYIQVRERKPRKPLTKDEMWDMQHTLEYNGVDPHMFADRLYQALRGQGGEALYGLVEDLYMYFGEPVRKGDLPKFAINSLVNIAEALDVYTRPLKAMIFDYEENLDKYAEIRMKGGSREEAEAAAEEIKHKNLGEATGEGGSYKSKDFDTGNIVRDIAGEMLSDPLLVAGFAKGAATGGLKSSTRAILKTSIAESYKVERALFADSVAYSADLFGGLTKQGSRISERNIVKAAFRNRHLILKGDGDGFRRAFVNDLQRMYRKVDDFIPDEREFSRYIDAAMATKENLAELQAVSVAIGMGKIFRATEFLDIALLFNSVLPVAGPVLAVPGVRKALNYAGRKAIMATKLRALRKVIPTSMDGFTRVTDVVGKAREAMTYESNVENWIYHKLHLDEVASKSVLYEELDKSLNADITQIIHLMKENADNEFGDLRWTVDNYLKQVSGHDLDEYIRNLKYLNKELGGDFDNAVKYFDDLEERITLLDETDLNEIKYDRQAALEEELKAESYRKEQETYVQAQSDERLILNAKDAEAVNAEVKSVTDKVRENIALLRDKLDVSKQTHSRYRALQELLRSTALKNITFESVNEIKAYIRELYEHNQKRRNKIFDKQLSKLLVDADADGYTLIKALRVVSQDVKAYDSLIEEADKALKAYEREAAYNIKRGMWVPAAPEVFNRLSLLDNAPRQFLGEDVAGYDKIRRRLWTELHDYINGVDTRLKEVNNGKAGQTPSNAVSGLGANNDGRFYHGAVRSDIDKERVHGVARRFGDFHGGILDSMDFVPLQKRLRREYKSKGKDLAREGNFEWLTKDNLKPPKNFDYKHVEEIDLVLAHYSNPKHPTFVFYDTGLQSTARIYQTLIQEGKAVAVAYIIRLNPDEVIKYVLGKNISSVGFLAAHEVGHSVLANLQHDSLSKILLQCSGAHPDLENILDRFLQVYPNYKTREQAFAELMCDRYARLVNTKGAYGWTTPDNPILVRVLPDSVNNILDKYIEPILTSIVKHPKGDIVNRALRFRQLLSDEAKRIKLYEVGRFSLDNQDVMGVPARGHLAKAIQKTGDTFDYELAALQRMLQPLRSDMSTLKVAKSAVRSKVGGALRRELAVQSARIADPSNVHYRMVKKLHRFLSIDPAAVDPLEYMAAFYQARQYVKLSGSVNTYRKGYDRSIKSIERMLNKLTPTNELHKASAEVAETVQASLQIDDAFAQLRLMFNGKSGNILEVLSKPDDAVRVAIDRLVVGYDGVDLETVPTQIRQAYFAAVELKRTLDNLNAYKELLNDLSNSVNSERLFNALVSEFQHKTGSSLEAFLDGGYKRMVDKALGADDLIVNDAQLSFVSYRSRIEALEGLTDAEKETIRTSDSTTYSNALLLKGVHATDEFPSASRMPKHNDADSSLYYTDFLYSKGGESDDMLEMSIIPKNPMGGDQALEIRRVYPADEIDRTISQLSDSKLRIMFPKAATREERVALFKARHTQRPGVLQSVAPDGHTVKYVTSDEEFLTVLESKPLFRNPCYISNNGTRSGFLEIMRRAEKHGMASDMPRVFGGSSKFDIMREANIGKKSYSPSIDEMYKVDQVFERYADKIDGYTVMPSSVRDLNINLHRFSKALGGDLALLIDGYASDVMDSLREISEANNSLRTVLYDNTPGKLGGLHESLRRRVKGNNLLSPFDIRIRQDIGLVREYFDIPENSTVAELQGLTEASQDISRRIQSYNRLDDMDKESATIWSASREVRDALPSDDPLKNFQTGKSTAHDYAFLEYVAYNTPRPKDFPLSDALHEAGFDAEIMKLMYDGTEDRLRYLFRQRDDFNLKTYWESMSSDVDTLHRLQGSMLASSKSMQETNLEFDIHGFTDARKNATAQAMESVEELYNDWYRQFLNDPKASINAVENDLAMHKINCRQEAESWFAMGAKSVDFIEHSLLWDVPFRIFDVSEFRNTAEFAAIMRQERTLAERGIGLRFTPETNLMYVYVREDAGVRWVEGRVGKKKVMYPVTNYSGDRRFKEPPSYGGFTYLKRQIAYDDINTGRQDVKSLMSSENLDKRLAFLSEGRTVGAANGILSPKKLEGYKSMLPDEVREEMCSLLDEIDLQAGSGIVMDRVAPNLGDFRDRLPFFQPPGMLAQYMDTMKFVSEHTKNSYLFINTWFGEQDRFDLRMFTSYFEDKKTKLQAVKELQDSGHVLVYAIADNSSPMGFRFETIDVKFGFELDKAIEVGAVPMPFPVYHQFFMDVNTRTFNNTVLKLIQKVNIAWKVGILANPATAIRNFLDEQLKNMVETEDPLGVMATSAEAMNLQVRYNKTLHTIMNAYGDRVLTEAQIEDIFKILPPHEMPMSYGEFVLLRDFMTNAGNVHDEYNLFKKVAKGTLDQRSSADIVFDNWGKVNNFLLTPMTWGDQNARLTQFLMLMRSGGGTTEAFSQLAKTHFDYSMKGKVTQVIELLIPFWNFTKMNTFYWIDTLMRKPWVLMASNHAYKALWDWDSISQDELNENMSLQNVFTNGNFLINDTVSLKFNPSMFNMYNVLFNPVETMTRQVSQPIRTAAGQFLADRGITSEALQGDVARNVVYAMEDSEPHGLFGEFIKEHPWVKSIPYIGQALSQQSYAETAKSRSPYPNLYNALTVGSIGAVYRWHDFPSRYYARNSRPDSLGKGPSFNRTYFEYLYGENGILKFGSWYRYGFKRNWHRMSFHYDRNYYANYYNVNGERIFTRPKPVYTEFYSDYYGKIGNWKMRSRMAGISAKNISQRCKDLYYYWKDIPQYRPRRY
jgi:hypothetical protein